jgi:hypothetical protein
MPGPGGGSEWRGRRPPAAGKAGPERVEDSVKKVQGSRFKVQGSRFKLIIISNFKFPKSVGINSNFKFSILDFGFNST